MKEIVHIYVRCSTDNQDVERQIDEGIKYSKKLGLEYKIYNDEGKSGIKSISEGERVELQNLFWEIEIGNVKHIWVETYDRLTRDFNDSIEIDSRILENEVVVFEGLTNQEYNPSCQDIPGC